MRFALSQLSMIVLAVVLITAFMLLYMTGLSFLPGMEAAFPLDGGGGNGSGCAWLRDPFTGNYSWVC